MAGCTSMPEQDVQPRPAATPEPVGLASTSTAVAAEALPALRRNAPLVPVDSAASRALAGGIAILTFVAALCAGAAELVAASSAGWRGPGSAGGARPKGREPHPGPAT